MARAFGDQRAGRFVFAVFNEVVRHMAFERSRDQSIPDAMPSTNVAVEGGGEDEAKEKLDLVV